MIPQTIQLSTWLTIYYFLSWQSIGGFAFVIHPIGSTSFLTRLQSTARDDEAEFVYSRRRRNRGGERDRNKDEVEQDPYYDRKGKQSYLNDEDDYDDDYIDNEYEDDEDDDDFWDEEDYDLFGNDIIPNPILDNMDPDGAAERFPELARDPRFWFDMLLFVTFLDLLSIIGPRDPYPDVPWV